MQKEVSRFENYSLGAEHFKYIEIRFTYSDSKLRADFFPDSSD